ncbi:MAG: hypothetical protein IH991_23620 [Planctomycetes bacterium]|nr:hypothetical protein [Planctomycetota bacterium]
MRNLVFYLAATISCLVPSVHGDSEENRSDTSNQDARPDAATSSAPVNRIATRQTSFTIPFVVDANAVRPAEIQLFASADLGANWTLYARQRPGTKGFPFRAAQDGEYWFALKTVDANGVARPTGEMKPELKLIVDTRPPRIDFKVSVGNAGQVLSQWHIFDENLEAKQFRVEYQPALSNSTNPTPWQQIEIPRPHDGAIRNTLSGKNVWWPKTAALTVNVRAVAHDTAGNIEIVNRRVVLPKIASRPVENRTGEFAPPEDPFTRGRQGVQWPADNETRPTSIAQQPKLPERDPLDALDRQKPVSSNKDPLVADQVSTELRRLGPPANSELPIGVKPRMTRGRQFNLRYGVDTVAPDQIAKVELWATRDGGRTWQNWGTDADLQSPFPVNVFEDAVYGFRVVVTTGSGIAGEPPRDGDAADIWIGVDTTKPIATITSAPLANDGTQLLVNWEAQDRHLSERPITLSFAEIPNGPLTTIAAGLPNKVQYVWTIDPHVPPQIYLRLDVRDAAGNQATYQLARPIRLDARVPTGRILGFDPLDNN